MKRAVSIPGKAAPKSFPFLFQTRRTKIKRAITIRSKRPTTRAAIWEPVHALLIPSTTKVKLWAKANMVTKSFYIDYYFLVTETLVFKATIIV